MIASICFWLVRWLASGTPTLRTPIDWAVGLLLLMVPITLWVTTDLQTTLPQVFRLVVGISFFYTIVNWAKSPIRIRLCALGFALLGIVLSSAGVFSVQWGFEKIPLIPGGLFSKIPHLISDTINANVLAGYLVFIIPLALGILMANLQNLQNVEKIIFGVSIICMTLILILSQSRGAVIALGFSLIGLILLLWKRGWILIAVSVLGAFLAASLFGFTQLLSMLSSPGSIIGTTEGRVEIWSRAISIIHDFPLTGVGMGLFGPVGDPLYPLSSYAPGIVPHAHNLLLQVGVDLGIPGLIAWLAIWLLISYCAWQLFYAGKVYKDGWALGIGSGVLCGQVALLVHGMTDAVTWGMVRPAVLVWVFWALPVAAWYVYLNKGGLLYIKASIPQND
jgi:O-antigen ligase